MAGDWIPVRTNIARAREILTISESLDIDRHLVLGLLVDFWTWLSEESVTNVTRGVTPVHLVSVIGGTEEFWRKVEEVGWARFSNGDLTIPNWEHWMGESTKTRMKQVLRKRRERLRTSRKT